MPFPVNCNSQEPSKFKKDTLTTLKLVRKYNPAYVTTFIVSHNEAHCLTGEDLRRCENMITLKKKKEINAKYSGLLKSKVKTGSYDIKNKRKCSARGVSGRTSTRIEKPKTPRAASAKSQSKSEKDVKSTDLPSKGNLAVECKKKSDVKEIFKSNVYTNFSNSTVDDSAKCPSYHLPTPKDIIGTTGSKIKTFWNFQKSMKMSNSENRKHNNKNIETRQDDNSSTQLNVDCGGITVTLKTKGENVVARKASISKRSCFSLIDIKSKNECRVLYKNCLLCNRRRDFQAVYANKINSFEPRDIALNPEKIVERRLLLEKRFIGFASSQFSINRVECATVENVLEEGFLLQESRSENGNSIDKFIDSPTMSGEKEAVENRGETLFPTNTSYKIVPVSFGIILSLYIIYLLYEKFASAFVIK